MIEVQEKADPVAVITVVSGVGLKSTMTLTLEGDGSGTVLINTKGVDRCRLAITADHPQLLKLESAAADLLVLIRESLAMSEPASSRPGAS